MALAPQDSISLQVVNDDSIYYQNYFRRRNNREDVSVGGKSFLYSNYVKVDVRQSKEDYSYIEVRKRSRGRNVNRAQENASKIKFEYKVVDNKILVDGFFLTKYKNITKEEVVYFTLYLQEGITVYFDDSSETFLDNVSNTDDISDRKMVNHYFLMLEEGLDCTDCEEEKKEETETEVVN